ncbi:Nramp family divalent metal transporter [Niabella soli]|uniref:Manganese transporter n=1 Tax=Niabella soli DSM 19437 TaxID=929713 RepID=W0EZ77_9BACT|nr:Nramp family divalent metal transporter [Niabella soli]AHF14499.1 manganese transporter [Niabella soli DSM 19437]
MRNTEKNKNSKLARVLHVIGPGIITAALVFGPSKMTITTKLGAAYGYDLLWAVVAAIFFMAVFTNMSSRIALAADRSFLSLLKERWGKPAAILVGIGVFLVTASFQAGNSTGVGISLAETTGISAKVWIVLANGIGVLLLFFKGFYKILEKIMTLLIVIMLGSFIITFFLAKPSVNGIAGGLVPTLPKGALGLVIALFASAFSIVGALYQSYMVQERRRLSPDLQQKPADSLPGILILGVMASIVLICAASVLHPAGVVVTKATDMSKTLEPLFGKYAAYLFLIGLFGASFSSLIGNASVGGTLLGDALGYKGQLSSNAVRMLIALVMTIGAFVALRFDKAPLELIVLAQSVTILVVPFIGIAMFIISNDRKIMGRYVNTPLTTVIAGIGLLLLLLLAVINVKELFFK